MSKEMFFRNHARKSISGLFSLLVRLRLILLMGIIQSNPLYGQAIEPPERKPRQDLKESDFATQPVPRNMEFVSKLIGTELKKENQIIGVVEDVALDLETEHLALLVASNGAKGESKLYALLPFLSGDQLIKFDWEKKLTMQTQPLSVARAQAAELYRDFKQAIYWLEFAKKITADPKGRFDEKEYAFTFYSSLKNLPISDKAGTIIGKVGDVAIKSKTGEILYVVMVTDNMERRAIPLGAFVNEQGAKNWHIELSSEQILKFKPFYEKSPPPHVDRGWVEYVAIRYGREGLQSTKKE